MYTLRAKQCAQQRRDVLTQKAEERGCVPGSREGSVGTIKKGAWEESLPSSLLWSQHLC